MMVLAYVVLLFIFGFSNVAEPMYIAKDGFIMDTDLQASFCPQVQVSLSLLSV